MLTRERLYVSCILAATSATALHAQARAADSEVPSLSGGAVAAQVSTGVLGTAAGFIGGGLSTRWLARKFGDDEDGASRSAQVGAYAGAALLTAVGPALIGSRGVARGSYPAAVGGALAGGLGSVLLKKLGSRGVFGERGPVAIIAGLAIIALPSLGATLALNSTR